MHAWRPFIGRPWLYLTGVCVAVVFLAACDPAPDGPSYRDQSALIGVSSRYDPARFAGVWHVRGHYPLDAELVRVQRLSQGAGETAWELVVQNCDAAGRCDDDRETWSAQTDVPGADVLTDPDGGPPRRAVVLWVDEGFRTAAIGDPSGRFAWVLDRKPKGGADRIVAARQVLEFNGFDVSAMQMRP